jgi:hypothetical protein
MALVHRLSEPPACQRRHHEQGAPPCFLFFPFFISLTFTPSRADHDQLLRLLVHSNSPHDGLPSPPEVPLPRKVGCGPYCWVRMRRLVLLQVRGLSLCVFSFLRPPSLRLQSCDSSLPSSRVVAQPFAFFPASFPLLTSAYLLPLSPPHPSQTADPLLSLAPTLLGLSWPPPTRPSVLIRLSPSTSVRLPSLPCTFPSPSLQFLASLSPRLSTPLTRKLASLQETSLVTQKGREVRWDRSS